MKKVLFVLFFAAVVFVGCKKQEAPVAPDQTPAAAPTSTDMTAPTATAMPTSTATATK